MNAPSRAAESPGRTGPVPARRALTSLLRWLPHLAVALVIVVTAAQHLPRVVAFQAAALRNPFPTQGSESLIVHEAGLLARGQSIYVENGPDARGFISGPYTPLYFVAVAATLKLTPTVFAGGRAITFASWLVLLLAVGALAWAAGGRGRRAALPRALGALVAVVSLAVFSPGVIWAVRVKPTVPGLALAAVGLLVVQRAAPHGGREARPAVAAGGRFLWAVPLFVAAFFTKQTTFAAAVAATLFLLVHAGPRAAARFVLLGAATGGALFAGLTALTDGWLFAHTVADHRLPWQPQLLLNYGGLFLRDYWPLLAAGIVGAVALAVARVRHVAPFYLPVALLVSPTVAVVGADHDHLIELAAAAALALGAALAAALARLGAVGEARRDPLAWSAVPLVALLAAQVATGWTPDRWYARELTLPTPAERRQLELIVTNIRNTPGDALAEEIGLLLLAGKPVPYDDPLVMAALARAGRWDQRQLIDDLNAQRFSLVILPATPRSELWTPEVLAAVRANYTLKYRDIWFTWEAKRLR